MFYSYFQDNSYHHTATIDSLNTNEFFGIVRNVDYHVRVDDRIHTIPKLKLMLNISLLTKNTETPIQI